MSWGLVFALAAGAYAFKALGFLVFSGRQLPARLDRCLALIPEALIAALVVKDTFSVGQSLQIDARAAGVAAAVLAAWRKAPMIAVIAIGAAVTAAIRAIS